MHIDHIAPQFVVAKSSLRDLLVQRMETEALPPVVQEERLAMLPSPLVDSEAFLDKRTGLWRYEFGAPYTVNGELFGPHTWPFVDYLHIAVRTACVHVPGKKRDAYFFRLNDRVKHWETLAEMMPGARLHSAAETDFEVEGLGTGNKTIDWAIQASDRRIILDVKSRFIDLLKQIELGDENGLMLKPTHSPSLLFRSVEDKFLDADPDTVLQGAWITTHIKQDRVLLAKAFEDMSDLKVHFVILGDWKADVTILVRREQDKSFLLNTFSAVQSSRFFI
ncbi:hypothetical protein FNU76_19155 [Chitinimonas arctica]|uniref:Uncharacterized protein n=1 Tax=Chitinimonas arctica TaxID=2594795 RepID=A0A516SJI0_9NEIS|nr:hypothetical protein [Chitinimonas arctica]QDQ28297.1 hypothetical protein FNU76_19155 [Chitinimonas arctica]